MKNIHILPTDKPSRLYLFEERLILGDLVTVVFKNSGAVNQNIYITSDEEIKEGDWVIQVNFEKTNTQIIHCITEFQAKIANDKNGSFTKSKIILTTDQDLIKDGVQAIDDEFLKWFVKYPNCESVEDVKVYKHFTSELYDYKIIIPQEEPKKKHIVMIVGDEVNQEPKQETLEEAAEVYVNKQGDIPTTKLEDTIFKQGFIDGAKWQAERMISKEAYEDMLNMQKASNAGYKSKIAELQSEMYSEEDMKQFGLYLGDNLKKLKNKSIDEIFEQFKKNQ